MSLGCKAAESDVIDFLVGKGRVFAQTNDSAPHPFVRSHVLQGVLHTQRERTFRIAALHSFSAGASLRAWAPGYSEISTFRTNSFAFESRLRPENYTFVVETREGQNQFRTNTVPLYVGNYPNAPRVLNFAATQAIDPDDDFTLRWEPFAGGTNSDLIVFTLYGNDRFGTPIFRTSARPGDENSLNGTNTSLLIPRGTLAAGRLYLGRLQFEKVGWTNATMFPGAIGRSSTFSSTDFYLSTTGAPSPPRVIAVFPENGSTNAPVKPLIAWTFDRRMRPYVSAHYWFGTSPPFRWTEDRLTLISEQGTFGTNRSIQQVLQPWSILMSMQDEAGNPLFGEFESTFRTASSTNLVVPPGAQVRLHHVSADERGFALQAEGDLAKGYLIEASTNLTDWSRITAITSGTDSFTDTNSMPQRFYRARALP